VSVQAHPGVVATVITSVLPPLGTEAVVGDTPNVQTAAPAWVTVTFCPAMCAVAVRDWEVGLAPTVTVIVALPLPLVGATEVHDASGMAVHEHPAWVVTVKLAAPPPLAMATPVGETR
jgi:hypothetical protein